MLGSLYASGYLDKVRETGHTQTRKETYKEMYFAVGIPEGSHPIFRLFGSSAPTSASPQNEGFRHTIDSDVIHLHAAFTFRLNAKYA